MRCCPCSELQLGGGGSWHPSTPVPGVERSHVFLGLKGKKEKREGVEWGGSRRWGGGVSMPLRRSRFCWVVWEAFSNTPSQEL